jgi:site-specific recombinase XerD
VAFPAYRQGVPPPNKGRRYPPEPLTPTEVYALIDACGRGPAGRRNRALIVCLWRSGLRCGEALALMPKDVDLEHGRLAVLHGKGDRARVVAIDPAACAVLERWAQERRKLALTGRQPFFCIIAQPGRGGPLQGAYVRDLLKDLARKAGVEKRVHPHGLRHTYASYLLEQGVPLHHIRRMLGHSSLAVTERYADVNPAEIVERLRTLPWPQPQP